MGLTHVLLRTEGRDKVRKFLDWNPGRYHYYHYYHYCFPKICRIAVWLAVNSVMRTFQRIERHNVASVTIVPWLVFRLSYVAKIVICHLPMMPLNSSKLRTPSPLSSPSVKSTRSRCSIECCRTSKASMTSCRTFAVEHGSGALCDLRQYFSDDTGYK